MNRHLTVLGQMLVSVAAMTSQDARALSPAVDLSSVGVPFETAGQFTLGFQFEVSEEFRVFTLGVFDSGRDGLASQATVTLWLDDAVGTPLASALVPAGTAASLVGDFRYAAIPTVTLTPGVLYVVGAYLGAGGATSLNADGGSATGSFDARLFNVVDRYWFDDAPGGNGNDFPLASDGHAGGAWLGANFQLSPVPEPGSAALLAGGLGIAALWHAARLSAARRRRRHVHRRGGRRTSSTRR